jgi:acetyl-CoA carboxylase biotin carboxyl carrier protein
LEKPSAPEACPQKAGSLPRLLLTTRIDGAIIRTFAPSTEAKEARMDIKEVKELIQNVLQSDISEFELEHMGTRVRLKRRFQAYASPASPSPAHRLAVTRDISKAVSAETTTIASENTDDSEESALHMVTSPIVGTFYRASNPESEPYVKLGDQVREGSILCLVEAMKLMNEIPSDMDGEIVRIYAESGHPVEYGQKLFGIRPRSQS